MLVKLESRRVGIGMRLSVIRGDFWCFLAVLGGRKGLDEQLISGIDRAHQV